MSSDYVLGKRPEFNDAFMVCKGISLHWNGIGRALSIDWDFRKKLDRGLNIFLADQDRVEHILDKWMESDSQPVTWETLLKALDEVDRFYVEDSLNDASEYLHQQEVISKYAGTNKIEDQPSLIVLTQIDDRALTEADFVPVVFLLYDDTDWFMLGQKLGVASYMLGNIKRYSRDERYKRNCIISEWLETGTASWKVLAQALISLKKDEIAARIAKWHQGADFVPVVFLLYDDTDWFMRETFRQLYTLFHFYILHVHPRT